MLQESFPTVFEVSLPGTALTSNWTNLSALLTASLPVLDMIKEASALIPVPYVKPAIAVLLDLLNAVKVKISLLALCLTSHS